MWPGGVYRVKQEVDLTTVVQGGGAVLLLSVLLLLLQNLHRVPVFFLGTRDEISLSGLLAVSFAAA